MMQIASERANERKNEKKEVVAAVTGNRSLEPAD